MGGGEEHHLPLNPPRCHINAEREALVSSRIKVSL